MPRRRRGGMGWETLASVLPAVARRVGQAIALCGLSKNHRRGGMAGLRPAGKLKHAPPFFRKFRGPQAHPNRVEKPAWTLSSWCRWWGRRFRLPTARARIKSWQAKAPAPPFFMGFRGPKAHPNKARRPVLPVECRHAGQLDSGKE